MIRVVARVAAIVILCPPTQVMALDHGYVGVPRCSSCHEEQFQLWRNSHHDLAMQEVTADSVLGRFDGRPLRFFEKTSRFFRQDGKYMVEIEDASGAPGTFEIAYVFGVHPLQQYLVPFPDGRLQVLPLAWDSRPAAAGGQRWFSLADDDIEPGDPLHWTGPEQNWNFMCAECHSTNLEKNYDPAARIFSTTWSEIDVACEACHGPGADHVAWANIPETSRPESSNYGLSNDPGQDRRTWNLPEGSPTALAQNPRPGNHELETCAPCHSRRTPISHRRVPGEPFLDHYLPALLTAGLYHADGQIDGEVYVYGSFTQSRMYRAGVTCSDCHDPHSLELRAEDNGVCAACHRPDVFDRPDHHFHPEDTTGARCVECHMPAKTYMTVDPRRDHSIRIPRPDLTQLIGTPNACNGCHADQDAGWAAAKVEAWYGETARERGYAVAINEARANPSSALPGLLRLAADPRTPDLARATALHHIGEVASIETLTALRSAATDPSPFIRLGSLRGAGRLPPHLRAGIAAPLLTDPLRLIRIEAARVLAPVPAGALSISDRESMLAASGEYIDAQMANSERADANTALGDFMLARGRPDIAAAHYRLALSLDDRFVPAYTNLADLFRHLDQDRDAEKLLRAAISKVPESAHLQHALGLTLVRLGRTKEALNALKSAAGLAPGNAHYAYVYAIALDSTGDTEGSAAILTGALRLHPGNVDLIRALESIHAKESPDNQ